MARSRGLGDVYKRQPLNECSEITQESITVATTIKR
jgi:hypothetical protein